MHNLLCINYSTRMKLRRYRVFICLCVIIYIYYFFGVGDYLRAKNLDNTFDYPLNIDIKPIVKDILDGKKPDIKPINYYPFRFLTNSGKCNTFEHLDLLILVKSAIKNFANRDAVRKTYGQENIIPGKVIKTLFFLGSNSLDDSVIQSKIKDEKTQYKDLIEMSFIDNYYNNTIKTMMSFRWAFEHCSTADYYLFTDDDMYISVTNLFDYVHRYEQEQTKIETEQHATQSEQTNKLYAGFVFESRPQRFKSSKWYVTLQEYPWNKWPRYISAGAYIVSNEALKHLYVGSLFVKHFRFDDIYLAIVAKKVGIEPQHSSQFYYYKKPYSARGYKDVIASHGYDNHEELIRVWTEVNSATVIK